MVEVSRQDIAPVNHDLLLKEDGVEVCNTCSKVGRGACGCKERMDVYSCWHGREQLAIDYIGEKVLSIDDSRENKLQRMCRLSDGV